MPTQSPFFRKSGIFGFSALMFFVFILLANQQPIMSQPINLRVGSGAAACGQQFVEIPVTYTQPDTSNAVSVTMDITFSTEVFQEVFDTPNSDSNRPQILRGSAISSGPALALPLVSFQQAAGNWHIVILASSPAITVPGGEILRLRFYPKALAPQGFYPVSILNATLFSSTGNIIQPVGTQNGIITINSCLITTTTSTTTTIATTSSTSTSTSSSSSTTTTTSTTSSSTLRSSTTTLPITTTSTTTPFLTTSTTSPFPTSTLPLTTTSTSFPLPTTTVWPYLTTTSTSSPPSSTSTSTSTTTTTIPVGCNSGTGTLLEFPQVAAGGGYRSIIYLSNPNNTSVQVSSSLFTPQGTPLNISINSQLANFRQDNIPAYGSLNLRLEDLATYPKVGWAQIYSTKSITGVLVYQFIENGKILSEATVFPSQRLKKANLMSPILSPVQSPDTGIAIANPGDIPINIDFSYRSSNGFLIRSAQLTLGPREQRAQYCYQIFNDNALPEGMVELSSSSNFIAIGLAYQFQTLISGNDVFTTIPIAGTP